jgi:hypothetical protein
VRKLTRKRKRRRNHVYERKIEVGEGGNEKGPSQLAASAREAIDRSPGSSEFHYEARLRRGETGAVIGTAASCPAYRGNASAITL